MRYLWILVLFVSPVFAIEEVAPSLHWPLPMPTEAQLEEARSCDFTVDDIESFEPESACEWMALAIAHAATVGEEEALPQEALSAYRYAVRMNPALPLHFDVLVAFWNRLEGTIPAPDFANQPISEVHISYDFGGSSAHTGEVHYSLSILLDDEGYYAIGDGTETSLEGETDEYAVLNEDLDADLINALKAGLTDLVPIAHTYTDEPCWHINSDWTVTLVFEDGTEITMRTYESNVLSAGGPWQTSIDEQDYFQVSAAFLIAVGDIHDTLELPWGEILSYGCGESQAPLEAGF